MNNKNYKICFILMSIFPTNKAYGVTTEFTARAASSLGYKVSIVTPIKDWNYKSTLEVAVIGKLLVSVFLSKSLRIMIRPRFFCFTIFYSILCNFKLKKFDIFWVRDSFLALLLSCCTRKKVICEIHHVPKGITLILLRLLMKKKNVLLAPISTFLNAKYFFNKNKFVLAPMGINSDELLNLKDFTSKKNIITYVGSAVSNNIFLDLNFILALAKFVEVRLPNWTIELIGFTEKEFKNRQFFYIPMNVKFLGYIPRSEVLIKLKECKIGLVTYGPDGLHEFPIKIVEYAAAGLAIVISSTVTHRRIVTNEFCVFYEHTSIQSALDAINFLCTNPKELTKMSKYARKWVENYTYESRVSNILAMLEKN